MVCDLAEFASPGAASLKRVLFHDLHDLGRLEDAFADEEFVNRSFKVDGVTSLPGPEVFSNDQWFRLRRADFGIDHGPAEVLFAMA